MIKKEKGIMLITLILIILLVIILTVVIYQVPNLYFLRLGFLWPILIGISIQFLLIKKLSTSKKVLVLVLILINTINIALPFILYNHAELIHPIIYSQRSYF